MFVGLVFVALMDVIVRAVLAGVNMVVLAGLPAVLMGMLVLVRMFVAVHMGVFVGVPADTGMFMLMLVFVAVLVGVFVPMFVIAFHGRLLFAPSIVIPKTTYRGHENFLHYTDRHPA